jgi:hypothetical protein
MSDAVMVPREPTEAMLTAGYEAWLNRDSKDGVSIIRSVWSAMIAASTSVGGWEDISSSVAAAPLPQGENADHVVEPNDMVSGSAAWDREVCTGCTSSLSIADIKARGVVSCCPDRHMVRIGDLVDAYTARPPRILPQTEKGS